MPINYFILFKIFRACMIISNFVDDSQMADKDAFFIQRHLNFILSDLSKIIEGEVENDK